MNNVVIVLAAATCVSMANAASTIDGFHAFTGDCMNSPSGSASPLALPSIGQLVSGGLKALGGTLKAYGDDETLTVGGTVNLAGISGPVRCLHIVYGPVYTNARTQPFNESVVKDNLPLPWLEAAKGRNAILGGPSTEIEGENSRQYLLKDAVAALKSSGALLAGPPLFFAELRIVPSEAGDSVRFRLRSLYYQKPLKDAWFRRSSVKSLVVTVGPYDHTKALKDNLANGYPIAFDSLHGGTAVFFDDYFSPNGPAAWESPIYKLAAGDASGRITLAVGVLETTAGNKVLGLIGDALNVSADATAALVKDKVDKAKEAATQKQLAKDETEARTTAATNTVAAINAWSVAQKDYADCSAKTDPKEKLQAAVKFAGSRVSAIAAIANAEPLSAGVILDRSFLETPVGCELKP